jgi:hypothetical protein
MSMLGLLANSQQAAFVGTGGYFISGLNWSRSGTPLEWLIIQTGHYPDALHRLK